jgi:hypothetical protein
MLTPKVLHLGIVLSYHTQEGVELTLIVNSQILEIVLQLLRIVTHPLDFKLLLFVDSQNVLVCVSLHLYLLSEFSQLF